MQPPLQARSQQSLRRILDAAEFVMARQGYEKATISSICRRAGLTSGAFYARFSSKLDLLAPLVECLATEIDQIGAAIDAESSGSRSLEATHSVSAWRPRETEAPCLC